MCLRSHCWYDASGRPWRQLMLQKMTKLAEISSAVSSRADRFLCVMMGIFISDSYKHCPSEAFPPLCSAVGSTDELFSFSFLIAFAFNASCCRDSFCPAPIVPLRSAERNFLEEPGKGFFFSPPFPQPGSDQASFPAVALMLYNESV